MRNKLTMAIHQHVGDSHDGAPTTLLTPWSRVLLENLTGSAASQ